MGLSSIFKRKNESASVNEPVDEVQRARTRARQRLIGAMILLAVGVVGFPLVFDTQPRPIPVDIPIEIPSRENAPPLLAPTARGQTPTGASSPLAEHDSAAEASTPARDTDMITESRDEPGRDAAPVPLPRPSEPMTSRTAQAKSTAIPEAPKAEPKAAPRPDQSAGQGGAQKVASSDDGARALALLDGKSPAPPGADGARYVVQVGAFADANAAQGTRQKIERLGLRTYTQVARTPAGDRIRVRVGPFATRDEADKALGKARSAGLAAVVLAL